MFKLKSKYEIENFTQMHWDYKPVGTLHGLFIVKVAKKVFLIF